MVHISFSSEFTSNQLPIFEHYVDFIFRVISRHLNLPYKASRTNPHLIRLTHAPFCRCIHAYVCPIDIVQKKKKKRKEKPHSHKWQIYGCVYVYERPPFLDMFSFPDSLTVLPSFGPVGVVFLLLADHTICVCLSFSLLSVSLVFKLSSVLFSPSLINSKFYTILNEIFLFPIYYFKFVLVWQEAW